MPLAINFVSPVTVITTSCRVPVVSVARYTHSLPGFIGQYGLSISVVKSAGSRVTGSLPWGRSPFPSGAAPLVAATLPAATAHPASTATSVCFDMVMLPWVVDGPGARIRVRTAIPSCSAALGPGC